MKSLYLQLVFQLFILCSIFQKKDGKCQILSSLRECLHDLKVRLRHSFFDSCINGVTSLASCIVLKQSDQNTEKNRLLRVRVFPSNTQTRSIYPILFA